MWMRIASPGLTSSSQTGFVNRCGPHHCATCFGSVQALNTSSRGASKTRVSTNSRSSFVMMFPVAMLFLLFPYITQIVIQAVKALRPEPPVVRHPVGDVLERTGSDPAGPPLGLAPAANQTGVFQHLKVSGDSWHAHRKGRSQFRDGGLAGGQAREDGAASGVGESGEGSAEMVGRRWH